MTYNLIAATDEHMTRPGFSLPRYPAHNPSSASVKWNDSNGLPRTSGTCLRQLWYKAKGIAGGVPDAYSEWIFATGKGVEVILVEQWKEMGIWVANNIKFYDPDRHISGEIDVILTEPDGKLFGVEVKSFAGYKATKEIMGNAHTQGHPKTSQLLQTLIYIDLCKKLKMIEYFKIVYYARDSGDRREFDVSIIEDGEHKRPTINGIIDYRFTMQDIYDRYTELDHYLENNLLPPRDYSNAWPAERIEEEYKAGEVSKTKYLGWKKSPSKNPVGDWQCTPKYCPFYSNCWKSEEDK
jgi:hypothetical protein